MSNLKDVKSKIEAVNRSLAVIEFDIDGNIINVNDNFLKMHRYKKSEVINKHHNMFLDDVSVKSQANVEFWGELRKGISKKGAFKRIDKYGKTLYVSALYTPIIEDDKVVKIIKLAQDITADKELSIYYSEQIEAINSSNLVAEFNKEGILIKANNLFLETFGYSLDEVVGKPYSIFLNETDANSMAYKEFWADLKQGKYKNSQYKLVTKTGTNVYIQASYNPIQGIDGKIENVVLYATNITTEKEKDQYYKGLNNAIINSQAVIEFNKNGVVLDANDKFLETFDYHLKDIRGKHHSLFCTEEFVDSNEYKKFWNDLKKGKVITGEFKRLDRNGNIKYLFASYNPIYGLDDEIVKIIKFAKDITEEKRDSINCKGQIDAICRSQLVIEFDINGVILNANNSFLDTFHYTLEDVLGRHHSMFVDDHFAGSEEYRTFFDKLKSGSPNNGLFKRKDKFGNILFLQASYNPIYGLDGKVARIIKYAYDMTAIENQNLFNKLSLESIYKSQAYIEFDVEGKVLTANDNFLSTFGYTSLDEIKGKHHRVFCEEELYTSDAYAKAWRDLKHGKIVKGTFKRVDRYGNIVWINASYNPIYGVDDKITKIVKFAIDITAKKEEELILEGWRNAIHRSQLVIEFDVNGIVLAVNENFTNVFGFKQEELLGKHHSLLVDKSYRLTNEYKNFWKFLKKGEFQKGEYKRFKKDGSAVFLAASYNPIYDTNGKVTKIVKLALDITEQKEKGLYYRGQIKAISKSQAIIEFDPYGNIITANDNFLDTMHYNLDELSGKHHKIFCEDKLVASPEYEKVWASFREGKFYEGQFKRLDKYGRTVWIQGTYNPIYGINGEIIKVIKFAHNITKDKEFSLYHKGQIEAIRRSQAVVEFDVNGVVLDANDNFLQTFNYSLEEVVGKHHSMFVDDSYKVSKEYKEFWDNLKAGQYYATSFKRINKQGKLVWIRASYNPIKDIDGKVHRIVKFAHDITKDTETNLYTKSQVDAINRAQAVIEFDMNGTILSANQNFLEAMGYGLNEIVGKHHSMFCEKEFITSTKYNDFWDKLQGGEHDSGKYLRIGKDGKKVWIRATYTPILNIEGKPVRILKYAQDITELETIKLDRLTGLYNNGKLVTDIKKGEINNLAILDTNEFDSISDFYGFIAGDSLIIQFSKILKNAVPKDFILYRLHDDRFAILNNTLSMDDFESEIQILINKVSSISVDTRVNNLSLTLTCGISYGDSDEIINFARTAHNHAKNTKETIVAYSRELNIEEQFENKIFWSKKIKSALDEDRVITHYQAIYNNHIDKIEKHEVLVRLMDKDRTLIYPNNFLDIAKTSRQYLSITRAVIEKSFNTFKDSEFSFSINMTMEDILDMGMQEFLFANIRKYKVGNRLIIEIVESEQIKDYKPVMDFVNRLREYGVKIAIDDFGSGYSNFNYLLEIKADFVKIDGSIVKKVLENEHSSQIIKSIVSFAKSMGIETIAEFVSSEEILEKVKSLGVDYSQGYYINVPSEYMATEMGDVK